MEKPKYLCVKITGFKLKKATMRNTLILLVSLLTLSACGQMDKPTVSFYLALQRGDLDQIERHIHWGADINQPLPKGELPLQIIAGDGRPVITKLLIKNGADINVKDGNGKTPLHWALENGRTQIADTLIDSGAKLDATAMLLTLVKQQVTDRDTLRFLVRYQADINAKNKSGETPLTLAIKKDNLLLTKNLIRAGANVDLKNSEGKRPLEIATQIKNPDIIRFLRRNGAAE